MCIMFLYNKRHSLQSWLKEMYLDLSFQLRFSLQFGTTELTDRPIPLFISHFLSSDSQYRLAFLKYLLSGSSPSLTLPKKCLQSRGVILSQHSSCPASSVADLGPKIKPKDGVWNERSSAVGLILQLQPQKSRLPSLINKTPCPDMCLLSSSVVRETPLDCNVLAPVLLDG